MRKRKMWRWKKRTVSAVLAAALALSGCSAQNGGGQGEPAQSTEAAGTEAETALAASGETEEVSYRDDFYEAVNGELLDSWEIPADQTGVSWIGKLSESNYQRLDEELRQASQEDGLEAGSDRGNIGALYLTGLDWEARDAGGYGQAAAAFFDQVDGAETVRELLDACLSFQREYGIYSLIGFSYAADPEDSEKKVLYLSGGDTGLEKEVWFSDDENNRKMAEEFARCIERYCRMNGGEEETAERVTAMMKDLAEASLGMEELYDAQKTYNVYRASDLEEWFGGEISMERLEELFGIRPDEKMIVQQVELLKRVAGYMTEENLPLLKDYVKVCCYRDLGEFGTSEAVEIAQDYDAAVNGTEKKSPERLVSEQIQNSILPFPCGRVFCEKYFTEEARADVEAMVDEVIAVYDRRLDQLEWMTEATREEARKKLAALDVEVGYPQSWPQDRYELTMKRPEEGGLYIDNCMAAMKAAQDDHFARKDEPVDKTEWVGITPQTVNAFYDPSSNKIVLLAGILQDPLYSVDADPVVNLGRIGMVIGHEITHAFDDSGSQYDENGNLRNWWTEEDQAKFKELAQKTVDYYDTMEVEGIQVNGELTLSENIADLGAVACITEIAQEKGYDLRELYKAYASLWAAKERPEYLSYLMAVDVHSPKKIRVNAVLSATDGFYEAFDIQEGDGMYRKPEDRPKIW